MKYQNNLTITFTVVAFLALSALVGAVEIKETYLYNLSNFSGKISYDWARVVSDNERNEVYVLFQNTIKVFNENGMEIYSFGDENDLGHILDISIEKDGKILLLTYGSNEFSVVRCNFRGDPQDKLKINNLPSEFSKFVPNRMVYRNGDIYLLSQGRLEIVVLDRDGNFKEGYDLVSILELKEKEREDSHIEGFSVDKDGNMIFTIPVLFSCYKLTPDKKLTSFGKPGSSPGKFNILAGIATDSKGNFLVVDKLKCAIIIFDKDYNFVKEFGYRGLMPGNLIAPDDLAVDGRDRIYVSQARKRGISVFSLTYN